MNRSGLAALLARSAGGDVPAFLEFYDATQCYVYALEARRAAGAGARGPQLRAEAQEATVRRYVQAWKRSGEQAQAGLSPLAWLLALPATLAAAAADAVREADEAACA